jgi:hypothetical protein
MADVRFVLKSVTKPATKSASKMLGALALVGALAGAGALLVWGCTDNSGSGKFVEPKRPFPDAAADGSSDGARDGRPAADAAGDGNATHVDGANADLRAAH